MFTVSEKDFSIQLYKNWQESLLNENLLITALKRLPGSWTIFVYDYVWIRNILKNSTVVSYLKEKGYTNPADTELTLHQLFIRIQTCPMFPHEVGIFLGYPVDDVINFEEQQGHNCKYCGYWHSYCHPEEAKLCCARYKECCCLCEKWFEEGYSIPQIIRKYKEEVKINA